MFLLLMEKLKESLIFKILNIRKEGTLSGKAKYLNVTIESGGKVIRRTRFRKGA